MGSEGTDTCMAQQNVWHAVCAHLITGIIINLLIIKLMAFSFAVHRVFPAASTLASDVFSVFYY